MARLSMRFMALMTRGQLAEMIAPTYAKTKNIDPNEAYLAVEPALRELTLIEGLQQSTWRVLRNKKPDLDDNALVDLVSKKLSKPRRFKPAVRKSADEGAWLALTFLVDRGAGTASGEALDLLETDGGKRLLQRGFELAGEHLAKELLR